MLAAIDLTTWLTGFGVGAIIGYAVGRAMSRAAGPPPAQMSDEQAARLREDPQFSVALASGKKLLAIKRARELCPGLGLAEAKQAVDRLEHAQR